MDNVCYFLKIQFRVCQSGVPLSSEKIYTNLSSSSVINIYYGYTIRIASASNDSLTIIIENTALNLNLSFTIDNGETILLDLPIDNGTFKLSVFAKARCCAVN